MWTSNIHGADIVPLSWLLVRITGFLSSNLSLVGTVCFMLSSFCFPLGSCCFPLNALLLQTQGSLLSSLLSLLSC
jgi:hypothetical protein